MILFTYVSVVIDTHESKHNLQNSASDANEIYQC